MTEIISEDEYQTIKKTFGYDPELCKYFEIEIFLLSLDTNDKILAHMNNYISTLNDLLIYYHKNHNEPIYYINKINHSYLEIHEHTKKIQKLIKKYGRNEYISTLINELLKERMIIINLCNEQKIYKHIENIKLFYLN